MCDESRIDGKLKFVKQNFENRASDLAGEVTRGLIQLEQAGANEEVYQQYANHVVDWTEKVKEVILEQLAAYDCDIS